MSDIRDVARLMGIVVEQTSDLDPVAAEGAVDEVAAEAWDACVAWFARLSGQDRIPGTLLLEAEEANPWR